MRALKAAALAVVSVWVLKVGCEAIPAYTGHTPGRLGVDIIREDATP